ncbi:trehalose-phosphatase [Lysobacter silvisoli]|uniref:Trehalose 6-phosphate phosphatase n=1 Tax=Lysobacter silvisoli TaxID=2293254 RepID=A0A371K3X7_9GAMM|nr:trehalose-phosphatase [Lysobacter silvisoli]RDZ28570.1 trehalose-phosphatase [Lysobacter silvisoli]
MAASEPALPAPPVLANDWALFLDVDGCLLEHAPTPQQVCVPERLGQRLCGIAAELNGALALVSGRSIAALDGLFPECAQLCVVGLHGLERRGAQTDRCAPEPPPALAAVLRESDRLLQTYPGACVEMSGPCLNLHWRAAPQAATAMTAFAEAALPRLSGYGLHRGAHGIEVRPGGSDKGSAIAELLQRPPFRGRRPVFVGDDPADECGFAVVNAHDGISVLVGRRANSAAHHGLPGPEQVRRWLGAQAQAA